MESTIANKELVAAREFAQFLIHHRLDHLAEALIKTARELDLPLLRHLSELPEVQLLEINKNSFKELLGSWIQNSQAAYIEGSIQRWLSDDLQAVRREQISLEDVALINAARKKVVLGFIPEFAKDIQTVMELVQTIEDFFFDLNKASYRAYIYLMEKRSQEQLAKSEQSERLLKQAQSITHIGNYWWDFRTGKLEWTDELYRIYGIPLHTEISHLVLRSYNHPDDQPLVEKTISRSRETLEPFDFYYRIILPNNEIKYLHAKGEMIAENGIAIGMFGTTQDVTKQKQIEEKLVQNERFMKKIADATPSLITSYNVSTGEYTYVNKGLKSLLGYEPAVALKEGVQFFVRMIHPDDLARLMEENNRAIEQANATAIDTDNEMVVEFKYRMRHANGDYRWVTTFGTVLDRDTEGKVQNLLNISIDITNQVKAENTLMQQTLELTQSNARLQEFAFIASHDLREPLRKISLYSERLAEIHKRSSLSEGDVFLRKITESSDRLQEMVRDLLSIAQLSGQKTFIDYDLEELLTEAKNHFEHKIEELHATITSDRLPSVKVVPSQMRQLFQNLIHNALKFSRTGVEPLVSIRHSFVTPDQIASLNLPPAERYIMITVADNGIGFKNDFTEKIFGIFQRLHSRDRYEGVGMGLAICKKVMENHGGTIIASGTEGEGAVFTMVMPA